MMQILYQVKISLRVDPHSFLVGSTQQRLEACPSASHPFYVLNKLTLKLCHAKLKYFKMAFNKTRPSFDESKFQEALEIAALLFQVEHFFEDQEVTLRNFFQGKNIFLVRILDMESPWFFKQFQ